MHYGASTGILQIPGTPEQVADQFVALWRATGCFGFNVTPTINNSSIADFVDQVVPLLQRQGALRTEYRGKTFRDTLNN
jgi:alkanesulfonate monooxygenase SsuD/methylene tetrahydromethanopterin reductase-like flavin-dependent oxidoreductase (luciferase family)